ncbi:uncharacterized protein LOC111707163 isoform X2 [Eurytemora carolleeae]|uniref:uncharacterized protein LOC111707163 isoform X2 n=1 Tax=Eurytemora carolleeae TaxID=1294199 RepID=UPI000C760511|nr:uncharacterized protein LOC111707163 isoform X2 [Eurytemora carolleeae]|eukprot:XP_023335981.1 uncharacterized protein LOC111707163 isoform X2 [Eurytemora affinis]
MIFTSVISLLLGLMVKGDGGMILDGVEYVDYTQTFINKTFKIEYHGEGQGMRTGWMLTGHSYGRITDQSSVRWNGYGEVVYGKNCGDDLCLESADDSFYFLQTFPQSRMVWRPSFYGLTSACMFRILCAGSPFSGGRCQIKSLRSYNKTILLSLWKEYSFLKL